MERNKDQVYDLELLDFDGIRLKKRRKLLRRSCVPMLVVVLVAIKLVSTSGLTKLGNTAYYSADTSSVQYYRATTIFNFYERYVGYFNYGDSLYMKADYAGAQKQFEKALNYVPTAKGCIVRLNLALTLEREGDSALSEKKYDQAMTFYAQALTVLEQGKCADVSSAQNKQGNGGKEENSKKAGEAEKRVKGKSDQAKLARNGDQDKQSDQGNEDKQDQPPDQSKEQKLQQKNSDAQKKRSEQQKNDSVDYTKNPGEYDRKVW